ncbi:MAG: hypothetical protein VSS75_022820 [Candidatus Parabeggiatoa sp.]|nr:hypothetical protein [Candidatus Parabeggiatoa sp.]
MKSMKYPLLIFLLTMLGIPILGYTLLSYFNADAVDKRQKEKYAPKFLQIHGVKEMSHFLYYEGHTTADIVLTEKRFLNLWHFNEESFDNTDTIELSVIGEFGIACWFNVIEYVQMKKPALKIRNIPDLVKHYDEVLELVKRLPKEEMKAEKIVFKAQTSWCYTKPWKRAK